ncbi:MAG: rod shape-determining protein MreD [Breznakibacter sp.]
MIKDIIRQVFAFIAFLLAQVLLVNNIHVQVFWFVNPMVYIGFVLLLPIDTPKWLLLVSAFAMGSMVDIFGSTPGMHASATVLTAFLRHYLHSVIIPRDNFQPATIPNAANFGLQWFIKYVGIMVGIHHFFLFFIEAFSFSQIHIVILKTLASGFFTVILLLAAQLFALGRNNK